jgi:hypothetical protein
LGNTQVFPILIKPQSIFAAKDHSLPNSMGTTEIFFFTITPKPQSLSQNPAGMNLRFDGKDFEKTAKSSFFLSR